MHRAHKATTATATIIVVCTLLGQFLVRWEVHESTARQNTQATTQYPASSAPRQPSRMEFMPNAQMLPRDQQKRDLRESKRAKQKRTKDIGERHEVGPEPEQHAQQQQPKKRQTEQHELLESTSLTQEVAPSSNPSLATIDHPQDQNDQIKGTISVRHMRKAGGTSVLKFFEANSSCTAAVLNNEWEPANYVTKTAPPPIWGVTHFREPLSRILSVFIFEGAKRVYFPASPKWVRARYLGIP